ncbi:hypothetical protein N186_09260 [Thermofilum adornatum]|uniref:Uncharacterized protein n=1 Tax=Thermofilum adornatum TaxID=1365176 RepID=S5ZG75_9CREN|nr:hypothetical protein [Thermofilum adornatum]AGT36188.1 hypothetical protein N186_09260 [Thermofilum adornatum]
MRDVVERYVELRLSSGVSREEYIRYMNINVDEIVEYDIDREAEALWGNRRKARERRQF